LVPTSAESDEVEEEEKGEVIFRYGGGGCDFSQLFSIDRSGRGLLLGINEWRIQPTTETNLSKR